MNIQSLQELFEEQQCRELCFVGKCHDCGNEVEVVAHVEDDGKLIVTGGAVYKPWNEQIFFVKCDSCFTKVPVLQDYQPVEVYSRVVGYLRPVKQWNSGKQAEFYQRQVFDKDKNASN